MSIIPQKKGNRKSDKFNFYSSVLLSENLYPDIVRMERVEIGKRNPQNMKSCDCGYDDTPGISKILFAIIVRNMHPNHVTMMRFLN
jgi:hypothetical protein